MPQVPPVRTPYTVEGLNSAFQQAWLERFGQQVPPGVLALLMALADLETNFQSAFHHNIGNIILPTRFLPTTQQSWFVLSGDEGAAAGAGDAEHHYKVYPTLAVGAQGLVTQLTRPTRQQWWDGLLTGDPESFVRALNGQNGGPSYFEAGFKRYLKAYLGRWKKYREPVGAQPVAQLNPVPLGVPVPVETEPPKARPRRAGRKKRLGPAVLASGALLLLLLVWKPSGTAARARA